MVSVSQQISNIPARETFATNGIDFLEMLLVTGEAECHSEENQMTSCVAGFCPESAFTADRKYNGNQFLLAS